MCSRRPLLHARFCAARATCTWAMTVGRPRMQRLFMNPAASTAADTLGSWHARAHVRGQKRASFSPSQPIYPSAWPRKPAGASLTSETPDRRMDGRTGADLRLDVGKQARGPLHRLPVHQPRRQLQSLCHLWGRVPACTGVSLSLSVYPSVCLSVSLSLSPSLPHSLSLYLYISLSPSLPPSHPSLSVCLSVCLTVFLSFSAPPSLPEPSLLLLFLLPCPHRDDVSGAPALLHQIFLAIFPKGAGRERTPTRAHATTSRTRRLSAREAQARARHGSGARRGRRIGHPRTPRGRWGTRRTSTRRRVECAPRPSTSPGTPKGPRKECGGRGGGGRGVAARNRPGGRRGRRA